MKRCLLSLALVVASLLVGFAQGILPLRWNPPDPSDTNVYRYHLYRQLKGGQMEVLATNDQWQLLPPPPTNRYAHAKSFATNQVTITGAVERVSYFVTGRVLIDTNGTSLESEMSDALTNAVAPRQIRSVISSP